MTTKSVVNETDGPMKLEDLERTRAAIDDSLKVNRDFFLILNDHEAKCCNSLNGTNFKKGINKCP